MKKDDEARVQARSDLEEKIREYCELCEKADYNFAEDIIDIICDATDREVILVDLT